MKKENNKIKKRIPVKFVFLSLVLATVILVFSIYFIITFSRASIKDNLKTAFSLESLPKIVSADEQADDGKVYNTKDKQYTYAYSTETEGLRVGLFATTYNLPKDNAAGSIKFYIGFNSTDQSTSVTSCFVAVGEKWHDYCSSKSTISNSFYSNTYLGLETMTFYNSLRSISIDAAQQFPKRYVLGMNNVKSPNIYVYVNYKYKGKDKSYIIEYDYDMYFVSGQTQVGKFD